MSRIDENGAAVGGHGWFKSSFSESHGACVEVMRIDGGVAVRDSKDPAGPTLRFTDEEWLAFLDGVWAGEFELIELTDLT